MYVKDWGPNMNISQPKTVGKILLSIELSHFRIILKMYGFKDCNKFEFLAWDKLPCLFRMCPFFEVLEKLSWVYLRNEVLKQSE